MASKILLCSLVVALTFCATDSHATDYKNEYEKKIKATQDIGALGNDLAGDSVNFYNGATTFTNTDLSVPGNSALPVSIGRTYNVQMEHMGGALGDWDLDVPYIGTVMTAAGGWISSGATPSNRCSVTAATAAPPSVQVPRDSGGYMTYYGFVPSDYWHGVTLNLPGGSQPMLIPTAANTVKPTTGGPYYWTTNRDWWFSCIPADVPEGYPTAAGEGFLALAPDGTRYWFDHMVLAGATNVEATDNYDGPQTWHYTLPRLEYRLYVSRVEDRFGNWVQYAWNGARLTGITANDGRSIQVAWGNNFIASITDGTRTVQYQYDYSTVWSLRRVVRDDGSYWQYFFSDLTALPRPQPECLTPNQPIATWDCYGGGVFVPVAATGWVRHPSGAAATFKFGQQFRYSASSPNYGYFSLMLQEKSIEGVGLAKATWKYALAPDVPATRTACRAGTCPPRVTSDETAPDGSITRRIFGALYGQDESLLQGELRGAISKVSPSAGTRAITSSPRWGTAILSDMSPITGTVPTWYSERDYRYVPAAQSVPYTVVVGTNPLGAGETFASSRRLPRQAQYLYERAATLSTITQPQNFNEFAMPLQVERSSTGLVGPLSGYSRTDTSTYLSDLALWVIGLNASTSIGGVTVSTDYHPTLRLPTKTYRNGLSQGEVAYNTDGTIDRVKDPRGNTTYLSGWTFGTPTSIIFPDSGGVNSPQMSASVSTPGKINWVTNEVGARTCYSYDSMLRMSGITFPSETSNGTCDSSSWTPGIRSFTFETSPEYGLPGEHWKQTVSTGTGKSTTLFNAMWQPVLTLTEDTANAATRSFVVNRYDTMGRKVFTSYPVASATVNDALTGTYTDYDIFGRPWRTRQDSELGVLTSTILYLDGFQSRTTNPRGFSTTTSFQIFDDPGVNSPVRIEAPEGITTVITRDLGGDPLQVTRSGPAG